MSWKIKKTDSTVPPPLHPGCSTCKDPGQEARGNAMLHPGKGSLPRGRCPE